MLEVCHMSITYHCFLTRKQSNLCSNFLGQLLPHPDGSIAFFHTSKYCRHLQNAMSTAHAQGGYVGAYQYYQIKSLSAPYCFCQICQKFYPHLFWYAASAWGRNFPGSFAGKTNHCILYTIYIHSLTESRRISKYWVSSTRSVHHSIFKNSLCQIRDRKSVV